MSSAIDGDVARTVGSGRETLGAVLETARAYGRRVFVVFVIGFIGTIFALQEFLWYRLKADLNANPDIEIIAVTPFDVILLQIKIGLVVGILLSIPVVVYYARPALRERGLWGPDRLRVSTTTSIGATLLSLVLLTGGVAYAYTLFFPLMLDFLASNATSAGFEPTYSIVKWAQFILFLSLSFGLAAQLPLAMSGLSYGEIVPYETFRDRWRYAVLGIFAVGALFSPPEPFTQIMWALPLLVLYGLSLGLARLVVTLRVSSETLSFGALARQHWNTLLGAGVLGGGVGWGLSMGVTGLLGGPSAVVAGVAVGTTATVAVGLTFAWVVKGALDPLPSPERRRRGTGTEARSAADSMGDPTAIDLSALDLAGARAAPEEAFAQLTEEDAVAMAQEAIDADEPARARLVLDRFDRAQRPEQAEEPPGESDVSSEPLAERDLADLDIQELETVDERVFRVVEEQVVVELAGEAVAQEEPERAQLLLDRFDAAQEPTDGQPQGTWRESADGLVEMVRLGSRRIAWQHRTPQLRRTLAGVFLVVAASTYGLSIIPAVVPPSGALAGRAPLVLGVLSGLIAATLLTAARALGWCYRAASNPAAVDWRALDTAEIETAPSAALFGMLEADAAAIAASLENEERAAAMRERYDRWATERETADTRRSVARQTEEGGVLSRTGTGMLGAFSETSAEDDIGGYYYDLAFIVDSLTSKAFWVVGWFMLVLSVVFVGLYRGGIGILKTQFYARLPESVLAESVQLVTLHPVEALIFEIKIATLIGAFATLPLLLYFAWPALKERGFARGDRNVLVSWGGTLGVGLLAGSLVGFLVVAPSVISWLAADVAQNQMLIRYRINNFGWLVFFTTVGVGLMANIPLTMLLFHRGGLVHAREMASRWRGVTIAVLAVAALGSPKGIYTMFLLGVPVMGSYAVGLALLSLYRMVGGREGRPPLIEPQDAD